MAERSRGDMLSKGLSLLTLLGSHPTGVGVTQLARQAGMPISTTHRMLATLVDHGYAYVDPESRRYGVGIRIFQLTRQVAESRGLAVIRGVLQRLADQTTESALMGVLDGSHMLYLEHVEGAGNPQVKGNVGQRGPLHCTSMGKVLLAFLPEDDQKRILAQLDLRRYAAKTITDPDRLRDELRLTRDRGYGIADEEHEPGIRAVSVPVISPWDATSPAVVCLAAPVFRTPLAKLRGWVPLLREAAREIELRVPRIQAR